MGKRKITVGAGLELKSISGPPVLGQPRKRVRISTALKRAPRLRLVTGLSKIARYKHRKGHKGPKILSFLYL